jgi:hypothetical protein
MRFIHARIKTNLNNLFEPYYPELNIPADFYPVTEDFDEEQQRSEVLFMIAPKLFASTQVDMTTRKWTVLVYKTNKDGSITKKFPRQSFEINLPPGDEEDDDKVTAKLMGVLLRLENDPLYKSFFESATLYHRLFKPAMQAALEQERSPRTVEVASVPRVSSGNHRKQPTRDYTAVFWIIGALIVAALIGGNANNNQYPDNCDFVPDPRGGYVDC